jgi:hypothetical protein
MKPCRDKSGVAILLVVFAIFATGVVGSLAWKSRKEGASLYPSSYYPYQGHVMIGTNQAPEPKW